MDWKELGRSLSRYNTVVIMVPAETYLLPDDLFFSPLLADDKPSPSDSKRALREVSSEVVCVGIFRVGDAPSIELLCFLF